MDIKDKKLGLFFTRGVSLSVWDKSGILEREIKPYKELAEKFGEIFLFTYGGKSDKAYATLFPSNVKIIPKSSYVPVLLYTLLLPFIHRKELKKINIIKTNQMDGSWSAVIAKKLYGAKLVVRCGYEWLSYLESARSSNFKRRFAYFVEKYAYNAADKIIITSTEGKDFIKGRFKINEGKIAVIPNYVDTEKFSPQEVAKDPKRIIFVGRLEKVKNLFSLISGLKGIDAYLAIVGQGSLEKELKEHANKENVRVNFFGVVTQSDLPRELAKSAIFVLPSLSEGNPKVLLEAMSVGLAVIGSDITSITSIIKDGESGIISGIDVPSIHQSIASLLGDPSLQEKIGENARRVILESYSFEKVFEKEVSIYNSL